MQENNEPIVVFYHADCVDGFTGAWVAWKKFGDKASYIPKHFHDDPGEVKDKIIYMIDVVFEGEGILERLKKNNKQVTAIDHHISLKDITLSTDKPLFGLNHSGTTLAWKYFFPNKPTPKFLLAVEDVDIWLQKSLNSNYLYEYIDFFEFDFKIWTKLIRDFEISAKRKNMLRDGKLLYTQKMLEIDRVIKKNARLVSFEGYTVSAINSDRSASEIGHKLATTKPPFAIVWKEGNDGRVRVSLRGVNKIDCSVIAFKYGGGGHKNAAAFLLPSTQDIPWKAV